MEHNKMYYKMIDFLRFFACMAILFYHLQVLKGGYLAVCIFFTLSGYLSCVSAFKKEKFSLLEYYLHKLKRLYLPLVVVVFGTLTVLKLFPDIIWLNLKPETTSVLLGYNNFWQISTNSDYFARSIQSPFLHFWYISILLQFDLFFPFLFLLLRKIKEKKGKLVPCLLTLFLSIGSAVYFYYMSFHQTIMIPYYGTFTRIFSLLFGLTLGFVHSYYDPLVLKSFKKPPIKQIVFWFYVILLAFLLVFIDAKSSYFSISMIGVTLITCRLIDYSIIDCKDKLFFPLKVISFFASFSYEIYLLQYPIFFFLEQMNIEKTLRIFLLLLLLFPLSYLFHFCLSSKPKKAKICQSIFGIILLIITLFGGYQYIQAKDHSREMKALQEQLTKNAEMMEQKQQEYTLQVQKEEENWMATLKDLENTEEGLATMVANLSVVGVGDSVMLGAVNHLYQRFPNGYFDAKISRTAWVVNGILKDLKRRGMLGNPVVLNLGANGDCSESCKAEIINSCGNREIFWINVTNDKDVHVNSRLFSLAKRYKNVHIIDWNSISRGHPEYFVADGIHLTEVGKRAYTKAIYDSIYQNYLEKYNREKEEILKQHEEELKTKISFYGNDVLLNAFDIVQTNYPNAHFVVKKEIDFKELKENIQSAIQEEALTHKIVFAFDDQILLNKAEYQTLIELCRGHEIYILVMNEQTKKDLSNQNYENVKVIDFYQEIQAHNDYFMADGVHLTHLGNQALVKAFKDTLES